MHRERDIFILKVNFYFCLISIPIEYSHRIFVKLHNIKTVKSYSGVIELLQANRRANDKAPLKIVVNEPKINLGIRRGVVN
jgi:hypothetical protein